MSISCPLSLQDVVEKFPMELIREPTAFTSGDPKELYNNIFIFVVSEDPKRKYDNPTEMHIFQVYKCTPEGVKSLSDEGFSFPSVNGSVPKT